MLILSQKPKMAARIYKALMHFSKQEEGGDQNSAMHVLMMLAGVAVEMSLVFDEAPDEASRATLEALSKRLNARPNVGRLGYKTLPPATLIDREVEKGRVIGRDVFDEWDDCSFEFHAFFIEFVHDIFISWECEGFRRADMLRLFSECLYRGLAYELAAQEMCDYVIERKAGLMQWDLNSCIAALSALAGHKQASCKELARYAGLRSALEDLDPIIYTMTQEAVRLGVPAGSDWRFGLAANDVPLNAPYDLIAALEPCFDKFFQAISLTDIEDQAVACAKTAGRMLAITAGGAAPELEPVIAKPLAISAMTDTYKMLFLNKTYTA